MYALISLSVADLCTSTMPVYCRTNLLPINTCIISGIHVYYIAIKYARFEILKYSLKIPNTNFLNRFCYYTVNATFFCMYTWSNKFYITHLYTAILIYQRNTFIFRNISFWLTCRIICLN